jgi:hypothetical protein
MCSTRASGVFRREDGVLYVGAATYICELRKYADVTSEFAWPSQTVTMTTTISPPCTEHVCFWGFRSIAMGSKKVKSGSCTSLHKGMRWMIWTCSTWSSSRSSYNPYLTDTPFTPTYYSCACIPFFCLFPTEMRPVVPAKIIECCKYYCTCRLVVIKDLLGIGQHIDWFRFLVGWSAYSNQLIGSP